MTITKAEAEIIANRYLTDLQKSMVTTLQLTKIQEETFGWVFFFQSKEYLQTGNLSEMLAGNAPFIVNKLTGSLQVLGTAHSSDVYIAEYARLHA